MHKPLICSVCHSEYKYRTPRANQKYFYCSRTCRATHQSFAQTGANNPNFGKRWSDDAKSAAAARKKQQFAENPDYAIECGKSNRGVKFTPERIAAMHDHRSPDSYKHYHNDLIRKIIGEKSKEKWTPDFKAAFRKTMETAGHWIPLAEVPPYKLYCKDANWSQSMIDYFNPHEKLMLQEYGIFGQHNSKGWVRDHIVPRKWGFEMGIPAFMMRHPANLQFISHAENVKKGFMDRKLTINEKTAIIDAMFKRIIDYTAWSEQALCLAYLERK